MRVAINFQNERLDLEVPEERLVAEWHGPAGVALGDVRGLLLDALEHPREYPPLRQAVVPGDRVVIAFDAEPIETGAVLGAVCQVLQGAGVAADAIEVLVAPGGRGDLASELPRGVRLIVHDPEDRAQMAYLASTEEGRRIYLNRHLTDADIVVPVGRLGYDPVLGYRGPWGVIFPGLSDQETRRSLRSRASDEPPDRERPRPTLTESAEVSWLLGCQFQVGLVAGALGLAEAVAGLEMSVRDEGVRAVDRVWGFRADSRAELVVVGIGRPGVPTGIDDLAEGLTTASRLVRRGGKVVALSRAEGPIGPGLRRLIAVGDPRVGPEALRGHEMAADYPAARQLARALAWADIYLLSALGQEAVEDLSMVALDRPEEARRLVASSGSCLFVSQAELTRASVADESD